VGAGADNTGPLFVDWTSPTSPGVPFSASDGNRWNGNDKVFTVGWGVSVLWYDTSLVGDNAWHDCRFNTVQWNASCDADKLSLGLDVGESGVETDFTVPATGRYYVGGMQRGAVPSGSSAGYWQFQVLIDTGTRQVPIDRDISAYTPGVQQT
jgi:hypothetical protein